MACKIFTALTNSKCSYGVVVLDGSGDYWLLHVNMEMAIKWLNMYRRPAGKSCICHLFYTSTK